MEKATEHLEPFAFQAKCIPQSGSLITTYHHIFKIVNNRTISNELRMKK